MVKKELIYGAVGLLTGLAGGYFAGIKIAGKQFDKRLEEETAEMRTFYSIAPSQKFATPGEAVEALIKQDPEAEEALEEYQGQPKERIAYHNVPRAESTKKIETSLVNQEHDGDRGEIPVRNVFDNNKRDPLIPYIITSDEFEGQESGYIQQTLTFYAGDNTLCDAHDSKYDDPDEICGWHALQNFGKDSGDENVVYARSERLELDFEIVRSEGSYAHDVLGIEPGEELSGPRPSGRT